MKERKGNLSDYYENLLDTRADDKRTVADKLADRITAFGGSWSFIVSYLLMITVWVIFNLVALAIKPAYAFDPNPFVLLNLILSLVSSLQAPVIMMSQGRQDHKDRDRAAFHLELTQKSAERSEQELYALRCQVQQLLDREEARTRL